MMKEKFENVEIEVIKFDENDVIATSGGHVVIGPIGGEGVQDGGTF